MNRRSFIGTVSIVALMLASNANALHHGVGPAPTNATIPVTSLADGNYSANNWSGWITPATTVSSHVLTPNPNNQQILATSSGSWRDTEVSTYMAGKGAIYLRLGPDGQCIFARFNLTAGNSLTIGVGQNFSASGSASGGANGTFTQTYVNLNPSVNLTGYGVGGSIYTFGVDAFEIYLKINGVKVVSYIEWRLCRAGTALVWSEAGVSQDVVVTYLPLQNIFSRPDSNIFDPRDFGMREVAATTGSMSSGSNQITGVTAGTFKIGDQVIVCIGGESGAGARGTKGVGGTWPTLNYANTTAMNADHSQVSGTYAYDASSSPLAAYIWDGASWTHTQAGGGGQSYYTYLAIPLPLIATVTNVSGTTVTLNSTSAVATSNADIRLDCLPSFYVLNQTIPTSPNGPGSLSPSPSNIVISIPNSQSTADQAWYLSSPVMAVDAALPSGVTISGAGRTLTTLKSPKSCPAGIFSFSPVTNNFKISDMKYIGNNGANGYGFSRGTSTFVAYTAAIYVDSPGATSSGIMIQNIDGVDTIGACVTVAGNAPLIDSCTITMNGQQYDYMGWQFQLSNSSGGTISNCTATGAFLLKAFEFFACNGSSIVNCGGTNPLYSTNSSQSWTIDCRGLTINYSTDSYINQLSGAIDEAIFNVNDNAFGSGNTGTIYLGRHIQTGYVRTSDSSSLKFIQIATLQTGVSVNGSYPGGGGCSTSLDGLLQCPDYNVASPEYGPIIYSDAASTTVNGIRIKGTAITTPGHGGHFGNISILGATSSATNNVADVIQTGPTQSGNQTNAAYGGC